MEDALNRAQLSQAINRRELHVETHAVPVRILTTEGVINGEIHRRGENRLIDELNLGNDYIAVTNAIVRRGSNRKLIKADFLALRGEQIICVIPEDEEKNLQA
jgi:hypothetical protein